MGLCIASKLKTNDARNLSFTCKRFKNILPSFPRPKVVKVPDSSENQKTNDAHFTPKEYFRCPVMEHNVEKIEISLKWNDQGWGNRKGNVWLQLRRTPMPRPNPNEHL